MNKVHKYRIIQIFAMDYHSGMHSRGYKLNCIAIRSIIRLSSAGIFATQSECNRARKTDLYKHLVSKYAEKM